MDKHCKGCLSHHVAGHPQKTLDKKPHYKDYNDWCCQMGMTARKAIGHCKNKGLKREK